MSARPPTPAPGDHVGEADALPAGGQQETSCYILTVHPCTPQTRLEAPSCHDPSVPLLTYGPAPLVIAPREPAP